MSRACLCACVFLSLSEHAQARVSIFFNSPSKERMASVSPSVLDIERVCVYCMFAAHAAALFIVNSVGLHWHSGDRPVARTYARLLGAPQHVCTWTSHIHL